MSAMTFALQSSSTPGVTDARTPLELPALASTLDAPLPRPDLRLPSRTEFNGSISEEEITARWKEIVASSDGPDFGPDADDYYADPADEPEDLEDTDPASDLDPADEANDSGFVLDFFTALL